jgi:hypothetical protein
MSKSKPRPAANAPTPVTSIQLLRALLTTSSTDMAAEYLRVADETLSTLAEPPSRVELFDRVASLAERIAFTVHGDEYYQGSTYMRTLDGPNTVALPGDGSPQIIREQDAQAAFALGMAFALRLGAR